MHVARSKRLKIVGGYLSYYYDSRGRQHTKLVLKVPKSQWENRPFTAEYSEYGEIELKPASTRTSKRKTAKKRKKKKR